MGTKPGASHAVCKTVTGTLTEGGMNGCVIQFVGPLTKAIVESAQCPHGVVRSRKYLLAATACAVASLLNPYGYRLHIHIAQYLGTSFYFARISEFQSIDFHSFTAAYFETLLMLAIAAAVWHLHSRRFTHALLLLSWSHLALFSARNIPIFAVVAVPGISVAVREWLNSEVWSRSFKGSLEELGPESR